MFHPEPSEHLGEFHCEITAAQHNEMLGQFVEALNRFAAERANFVQTGNVRPRGACAGVDDTLLRRQRLPTLAANEVDDLRGFDRVYDDFRLRR